MPSGICVLVFLGAEKRSEQRPSRVSIYLQSHLGVGVKLLRLLPLLRKQIGLLVLDDSAIRALAASKLVELTYVVAFVRQFLRPVAGTGVRSILLLHVDTVARPLR
jgi:hypothetical protein